MRPGDIIRKKYPLKLPVLRLFYVVARRMALLLQSINPSSVDARLAICVRGTFRTQMLEAAR